MDAELIAIGDPLKIKPIISKFLYTSANDAFVISVPRNLLKYISNCLASEGVKALPLPAFRKALGPTKDSLPLAPLDSSAAYAWLRTGSAYFHVTYNGVFEMNSLDRKAVNTVNRVESVSMCQVSPGGAIYAFMRGAAVSFCIGDSLELIFDLKLGEAVEGVVFSEDESVAAVQTALTVQVCDIFRGCVVYEFPTEPFSLFDNGRSVYLHDSGIELSINNNLVDLAALDKADSMPHKVESTLDKVDSAHKADSIKTKSIRSYKNNKVAMFLNGEFQKIIYKDNSTTTKSVTHVKSVRFLFANTRLFAFLTKNPGSGDFYVLESYANGEVTSLSLDFDILDIAVSDDFFVLQLSNLEVQFYARVKYGFGLVQAVRKDGRAKLSCFGTLCCIFNSATNNVEFYDRAVLRSVYAHPGCTDIEWSQDGLYVSVFSYSETAGCLVQVFNSNGVLMFKKVYNCLSSFGWRRHREVGEDEKERILKEHSLGEVEEKDEDGDKDKEILAREWREYLLELVRQ